MSYKGFVIPGEAIGKGRPKFSMANGHAVAYTPSKTASYENLVKLTYNQFHGGSEPYAKDIALRVTITAGYQIPKSASKKKRQDMLDRKIRPTKKPDTDNVAKIICDALNGIAYYDDAQVVEITVKKYYSDKPETLVEIEEV